MNWLGDEVHSVRRAAADNLLRLATLFGEDWTRENIFPRLEKMHHHSSHLHRLTALYGMKVLVKCSSTAVVETVILPMMQQMAQDAVPNVRLNVARTLEDTVLSSGHELNSHLISSSIIPLLMSLNSDKDRDVRFYAVKVCFQILSHISFRPKHLLNRQ